MRALLFLVGLAGVWQVGQSVALAQEEPPASIDERATHEQTAVLKVDRDRETPVNAFCLSQRGEVLAACGNNPGEVRVFDGEGQFLRLWKVPIKPESINIAPDGTVLLAGSGQLLRYSLEGKELGRADSPHATAIKASAAKLREEAIAQLKESVNSVASQIEQYTQIIAQLEAKKEDEGLSDDEQQVLDILPENLERLKEFQTQNPETEEPKGPSEEAIQQQVQFMTEHKMRVASISADDRHVFIATPALGGYGFEVWRLDPDFQNGAVVVSDLKGCCGQMDVQACSSGIYVAENSRHRVVRFSSEGEQLAAWGQQDRTGIKGFTSCCNPMNVCFNKSGDVYTAESNTGRIKRFSAEGELLDFVGDVKLVPGCKNVSIAVSNDGQRVYMLDITRKHIVLMQRKPAEETASGAE